ncbi:MAG: thymidylate synthase [Candidatus Magasanikbacteria bacterium]
MLKVAANTTAEAWRKAFFKLMNTGKNTQDKEHIVNLPAAIEVKNTQIDRYDGRFSMSQEEIETINKHIVSGKDTEKVTHEWTKLYRKRLFEGSTNQIEEIIKYLNEKPHGKRAQANIWNQQKDLYGEIAPCLQMVWFQVKNEKLETHVHLRASDAYGKLLMNINEFISLHHYVADELNVDYGKYIQFIDTCHVYKKDRKEAQELFEEMKE